MNASRRRAASRVSRLARAEAPVVRRAKPAEALTRTPAEAAVVVAAKRAARAAALPADVAEDLVAGRLSQRCEPCGITEAAGGYCTSCGRLTGPADWFRQSLSAEQKAARRTRGHSTAETGATALEAANPERLTLADGFWF